MLLKLNNMKREEEIRKATLEFVSAMCQYCSVKEKCKETEGYCTEYDSQECGFVAGIQWADEHPKNVWNDASEEPTEGLQTILANCENSELKILKYRNGTPVQWLTFIIKNKITKWMYTHDILPKGGEK